MQRLWLDYRQPPPGHRWPGFALLAIGIAVTAWLIVLHRTLEEEIEQREVRVIKLQRQADQPQQPQPTDGYRKAIPDFLAHALASQSGAVWEKRFSALESAGNESVTLLTLIPEKQGLTLTGEAKNLVAARDYVKRLQGVPTLTGTHLADYAVAKDQPLHPIRFTVITRWQEGMP